MNRVEYTVVRKKIKKIPPLKKKFKWASFYNKFYIIFCYTENKWINRYIFSLVNMRLTVHLGPPCQLQPMMVLGAKDITNLCTNFSHRKTLRFNQKGG